MKTTSVELFKLHQAMVKRSFLEAFPEICTLWHESNEKHPAEISVSSSYRATFFCEHGHTYQRNVKGILPGMNTIPCPFCNGRGIRPLCQYLPRAGATLGDKHPEVIPLWHPTLNGTLTPFQVGPSSTKTAWFLLPCADGGAHTREMQILKVANGSRCGCDRCKEARKPERYKRVALTRWRHLQEDGVSWSMQSKAVQELSRATLLKKYGVPHISMVPAVIAKREVTSWRKRGCRHNMQDPRSFSQQQRSCFKWKSYVFPSSRVDHVQGYEPFCLRRLLDRGIPEEEIVTSRGYMPPTWYIFEGFQTCGCRRRRDL